jgi:hypothetical protein
MDTTRQPSLVDLAQTLFASPLQPLDHPTAGQVHGTVSRALDTCGGGDERDPGARSRPAHAHPRCRTWRRRWNAVPDGGPPTSG